MKAKQARSTERREAILDSALRCFRAEGFQGASIARICAEAGISPGHLYHYFDSKEAIIEAIVAIDRARISEMLDQLSTSGDPVAAMLGALVAPRAADAFKLDPILSLEVYAEAARNPRVAAILAEFNAAARVTVGAWLASLQRDGKIDPAADPQVLGGLLIAIADGLMVRETTDPAHDPSALAPYLQRMLAAVLRAPAEK